MAHFNRRGILKGASAIGFGSATGLLGAMGAQAADTSGYKALVCVMFKGGLDATDAVIGTDPASHDAISDIRSDLFTAYGRGNSSRARTNLLELQTRATGFGSRRFGLAPDLAPLHDLFARNRMAVVGNVGPLIEPTTRDSFDRGRAALPENLFSHNDQQSIWLSFATEGRRNGWGGEFAGRVAPSRGVARRFTSISGTGVDTFLNSDTVPPYIANGGAEPDVVAAARLLGPARQGGTAARAILARHFAQGDADSVNVLLRDLAAGNAQTLANDATFRQAVTGARAFRTRFPASRLGNALRTVAESISVRSALGAARQVFYADTGGFDTHNDQASRMPVLQSDFAAAIRAFSDAMEEIGMGDDVTLFTASDFGRTVVPNSAGTDHGWGSHHFVVGGAVRGGEIYGDIPDYDLGSQSYTPSRGRLIPSTSVDQYAATLGRWFGLSEGELLDSLPNLRNFQRRDIGLFG